jgi:sulfate transport system permease protein
VAGASAAVEAAAGRPGRLQWILVGIVVAYAALLILGPLAAILQSAFARGPVEFLRQITTPDALHALRLTLFIAVSATIIDTVFGVAVAYVLVRHDFPGRSLINGLVDLPFAVSPVIAGLMMILLFGREGWLTPLTDAIGIRVVFSWPAMLLATAFIALPFVIREVMPVLAQMGRDPEDAAFTLGASPWQTFRRITLPGIRWGLLYGVSLTFARAMGEFGAVLVVSGGVSGLTETATLYIFRSLDDRNAVGANAMAVVLAAASFAILMAIEFLRRRAHRTDR